MEGIQNNNIVSERITITIIDTFDIKNICLNDFNKKIITFGRNSDNDIILSSLLVSQNHGYFEITDAGLKVVDNNSTNGIFVNNQQIMSSIVRDGDSIKIDNPEYPLERGIIIIPTYGKIVNNWNQLELNQKDRYIIGRSTECDIVLDHVMVSLNHATIIRNGTEYLISDNNSSNGVIINGNILKGQQILKEKDLILIANTKLIYNQGRILYQIYNTGVRVDAIDIVKTVKVKGKKRDISSHVSLTIKPGEFVSFVGGSGAGKSTFMKCISGVNKPTSGEVYINGNELFSNYTVLKNIIGYVPQQDIVYTDLTLIDMLNYAADLRMPDDTSKEDKVKRIEEVLEIVELSEKKNVMIKNLSGGQKKRASIAVELIADPKLFFLDEPTSGLDPGTERSIMHTLRKMADSGKTIILVTHTTLNLHLCDKVVFFGVGGKLCFHGTPQNALNFFQVNDFVDIYGMLNDNADGWEEKFKNSPYKENVLEIQQTSNNVNKAKNNKSFTKQFITLSKRYAKTIFNNKPQLLLLLLQAPLIAYLFTLVVTDDLFAKYEETKTIMFGFATASIWLGLLNAIQEICKEKVILEKEYMADLKLSAYLGSKILVQSILGLIQAFLMVTVFKIFVAVPSTGVDFSMFTDSWYIQMLIVCFTTIISASSLGLVVSSFSKDTNVALSFAPILLVPELLFSGILFPLEGIVEKISNVILCRWATEGFGTINDLNGLSDSISDYLPSSMYEREIESYYLFTSEHLIDDIKIIILMMIILLVVCYFILKKELEKGR